MIEGAAASVTSNRSASSKSEFEFVDFKTPFSLRGQTPVSGRPVMMPPGTEASVTATKDLSDFFEETRRAKDLPVMLGGNENVEGGEDGKTDVFSRHLRAWPYICIIFAYPKKNASSRRAVALVACLQARQYVQLSLSRHWSAQIDFCKKV